MPFPIAEAATLLVKTRAGARSCDTYAKTGLVSQGVTEKPGEFSN